MIDPDEPLRVAAFAAIEKLTRQWAGRIPWNVIKSGFRAADGTQIRFAGLANGIFKPKQMSAALSIKTTVPRAGRSPWYRDQDSDSANLDHDTGLIRYDLARGGLNDPTNRALRDAMRRRAPLIYFIGLAPGLYQPVFPVWVERFLENRGYVLLAADDGAGAEKSPAVAVRDRVEASYSLTTTRSRNHQAWFSARTKAAYVWRCAFSGLPVRALLVGAHIVPDAAGGPPSIRNGICMSALHHVAFDSHMIGVDPDFRVHVSASLLEEKDGELLATIKDLDGTRIRLPADREDWPDPALLERRFSEFSHARGGPPMGR